MSFLSSHPRDPNVRAARLAGVAVLVLAIGAAASGLLGTRLGLRGRDANGPRAAREMAGVDAGGEIGPADPAAVEGEGREPRKRARRPAAGEGDASLADRSGSGGLDSTQQRDGSDENLLAVWDHVERRIAAAMAKARESVVALEYTAGDASAGTRRVASGVVINHRGEILSVRIDQPRAGGGSATAGTSRDAAPIVARDYLGRPHAAQWLAADPHTGLTLLLVAPRVLRPIRSAADGPMLCSRVYVVGNSFGMGHSVSPGYVAGLDRALELGRRQLGGLILVQAPLYPGDSGAAVVDIRGDCLGLIRSGLAIPGTVGRPSASGEPETGPGPSVKAAEAAAHPDVSAASAEADDDAADRAAEQDTDFGFAIPTRDALWIADQLRRHGRVDRAYLGVRLEKARVSAGPIAVPEPAPSASDVVSSSASATGAWRGAAGSSEAAADPSLASTAPAEPAAAPLPGEGARLRDVVPDTPAARAGLRTGDRIIAMDGQPIRSRNDLIDRLDRIPARKTIVLGVVREGEPGRPRFDVSVRTSSRPPSAPGASQAAPSAPKPARASVSVTPTAARNEPATAVPTNPSPQATGEPHPAPPPADPSPATPRQDPAPAPAPPTPERAADPSPPASVPSPVVHDLGLTLPRAVERIEQLERRIRELEQFRAGPGVTSAREPDSRDQPERTKSLVGRRP